jgi:hypothetical protein
VSTGWNNPQAACPPARSSHVDVPGSRHLGSIGPVLGSLVPSGKPHMRRSPALCPASGSWSLGQTGTPVLDDCPQLLHGLRRGAGGRASALSTTEPAIREPSATVRQSVDDQRSEDARQLGTSPVFLSIRSATWSPAPPHIPAWRQPSTCGPSSEDRRGAADRSYVRQAARILAHCLGTLER